MITASRPSPLSKVSKTNDEKPLIAYMSDVCASGGYYISMPADTLIASSGSIVGSIGVFGLFP